MTSQWKTSAWWGIRLRTSKSDGEKCVNPLWSVRTLMSFARAVWRACVVIAVFFLYIFQRFCFWIRSDNWMVFFGVKIDGPNRNDDLLPIEIDVFEWIIASWAWCNLVIQWINGLNRWSNIEYFSNINIRII